MTESMLAKDFLPISKKLLGLLGITMTVYAISLLLSMTGMELFGWFSALIVLVVGVIEGKRNPETIRKVLLPVDLALIGFFLVIVLGAIFKFPENMPVSRLDVIGGGRWIFLFIFLRAGLAWIWSERFVRKVMLAMMVIIGIVSVYAIWQYFNGWDLIRGAKNDIKPFGFVDGRPFYRAEGLFKSPMTFGYSLVISWSFILSFFIFKVERGRWRWLVLGTLSLATLALIATLTRGVWLASAGALFYLALCSWKRGLTVVLSVAVVMTLATTLLFPEVGDRINKFTNVKEKSNSQRLDLWRVNLEMFKENPLLGVGYGLNEDLLEVYYPKIGIQGGFKGHAHNTGLQILSGTGLLGGILFAIFVIYFLVIAWRLRSQVPQGWNRGVIEAAIAAQIAIHLGGLTECNFKDAEVNHQYLMALAVVSTLHVLGRPKELRTKALNQ